MKFNLPEKSFVNKFIPKSKFFEKAVVNTKLKNEFTNKIQRITWEYKLSEDTIGVLKTDNVEEIQIFKIELKEKEIPKNVLKMINNSIPYQIIYVFRYKKDEAFGVTLKGSGTQMYYFSDWDTDLYFDFNGINLEKVYQNIIKQFITKVDAGNKKFDDIIEGDSKIKTLEKDIGILQNKISKEKQFNKKVGMNKVLSVKKKELEKLQNNL